MNDFDPSASRPSYTVPSQANAEQHLLHDGYDVNTVADQAAVGQQPRDYYANVVHGGNVHFGDRYYVARETDSEQQRLDQLLESLSFPELRLRANQISDSYPETFEWLLSEGLPNPASSFEQYDEPIRAASANLISWLRSRDPVYWIYGKPGSGKSTLMKFLATHETTQRFLMSTQPPGAPSVAILTHYFWLSGSELQRSLKGCLATLLHQLYCAHSQLGLYLIKQDGKLRNVLKNTRFLFDWSTKNLKYLLLETTRIMTSLAIPCCMFVDGIDEFAKDGNVDEFAVVIEQLRDQGVKMCLSSRPEPHIQELLECYPKLRLQDATNHDVVRLALGQLTRALSRIRIVGIEEQSLHKLALKVADKAEGVFLWACLAIKSLVNGLRNGDSMTVLERRLRQLPSGIQKLYHQMWSRLPQEDQLLYRGEASLFLSMAEHLPISLLRFTVAMDKQLQERLLGHEKLTEEYLQETMIACLLMERKLHSRTAGLLTCVRSCEPEQPPPDWRHPSPAFIVATGQAVRTGAALSTNASPNRTAQCFCASRSECTFLDRETLITTPGLFKYMHGSVIALIHLSAAEFIFAEDGEIARIDASSREEARRRMCASVPVLRRLGCGCWGTRDALKRYYDLNASDTKISQLFRPWVKLFTQPRSVQAGFSCTHGFYHPEYMDVTGEYQPDCPDFLGLAAFFGGYQIIFDALQDTPGRVSSYYKGYLVICAARGLGTQSTIQSIKVNAHLKLMNWLIRNEANLLVPHVIEVDPGYKALMARSPIMECWLSMFRLAHSRTSLWTLPDTRELDALVAALTRSESMPGVSMTFVVGGSSSDVEVDFGISMAYDKYILIKAEVNEFGSYCAAKLALLRKPVCTTSDQQDLESPPKLSQHAKITYLSHPDQPFLSLDDSSVDVRCLSVAETASLLDAVEEDPAHGTAEVFHTLYKNILGRLCDQSSKSVYLMSVLAAHDRRLGMTDYDGQRYSYLVPPDLYHEPDQQTWYEQGELREGMDWRRKVQPD